MKTPEYSFLVYDIIKIFPRVICIDRNYLDCEILISHRINMSETKARRRRRSDLDFLQIPPLKKSKISTRGGSVGKPCDVR